jgi:hypothetical protein
MVSTDLGIQNSTAWKQGPGREKVLEMDVEDGPEEVEFKFLFNNTELELDDNKWTKQ